MKPRFALFFVCFSYTFSIGQPKITSFSPASGPAGTTVTISGLNFSPVASANVVYFGAVRGNVTASTATSISVTTPTGATYLPISVTAGGLTAYSKKPFALTTYNLVLSNSAFAPRVNLPSGTGPISLITSDLDNDGKPDIAVVNDTSNTLSIFRNLSVGNEITLAAKIDFPTQSRPRFIASGDLDGDGKQDLAEVNFNSNSFSVFRNTSSQPGIISLAGRQDFVTGATPRNLVIADFDDDGKPDIITLNFDGGSISIFRNTSSVGNVSFAARVDIALEYQSYYLGVADFNGDGKTDLAISNFTGNKSIAILKNTSIAGSLSFGPVYYVDMRYAVYAFSVADVDNDGKPDLTTLGSGMALRRNESANGEFGFTYLSDYGSGNYFSAAVGIFDNNELPEILASSNLPDAKNINVFRNASSPGQATLNIPVKLETDLQTYSIVMGDLNADGKADIVTANQKAGNISILKNTAIDFAFTDFSPKAAATGGKVMINGVSLSSITSVQFGGIPADSIDYFSPGSIYAYVGAGVSGDVTVSSAMATRSLPGFTYIPPPVINSFIPAKVGNGDTVTIIGQHFEGVSAVSFGGSAAAAFTGVNSDTIIAVINGGSSGMVSIITPGGTASKNGFVYVPPPVIYQFSPTDARPGEPVTITGTAFAGALAVDVGGVRARSFQVLSDSVIVAIADSIIGGYVAVTTPFGSVKLEGFYNGPVITGLSVYMAHPGGQVTIFGHGFSSIPSENIVRFGGMQAAILNAATNAIRVTVPGGAAYAPVSLSVGHLTAYNERQFTPIFTVADTTVSVNSFLPKTPLFCPDSAPGGVAIADLDGDGKNDIVVGNFSNQISIFRNNGSISTIAYQLSLNTALFGFNWIHLNDISGDGKPDIVAVGYDGILIFENTSQALNISFASPLKLSFMLGNYKRIDITDLDGDGKPDITINGSINNGPPQRVLRNESTPGNIQFSSPVDIQGPTFNHIACGDLNGDGKPDMVSANINGCSIYKNTGGAGKIDFTPILNLDIPLASTIHLSDIDQDGKRDILISSGDQNIYVARNISSGGNFNFELPKKFAAFNQMYDVTMHDLDGNGKPDFACITSGDTVGILFNRSAPGQVLFTDRLEMATDEIASGIEAGDLDNDGKPDIVVVSANTSYLSIYRNKIGEPGIISLCPPLANTTLNAAIAGTAFQWQVNTGSGFTDLVNNGNYAGVNTANLQLLNVPSSWNAYRYRCLVDATPAEVFQLRFTNEWTGIINNEWENTGNWACGVLPDAFTTVMINSGTVNINSAVTVQSLRASPGAIIQVKPGIQLKILH